MKRPLILAALLFASPLWAPPQNIRNLMPDCSPSPPTGACPVQYYFCFDTSNSTIKRCTMPNIWEAVSSGSGGDLNATYLTQTASSTLTAEQPLGLLSDGILEHASGVVSRAVPQQDYLAAFELSGGAYEMEFPAGSLALTEEPGRCAWVNSNWGTSNDALVCRDAPAIGGELLSVVMAQNNDTPADGETLKFNTGGTITWEPDLNTGTPSFATVTAGTNTAALVMGTGGSLTTTGSGSIVATTGDSATSFFSTGEVANAQVANDLTISGGTVGTSAITLVNSTGPTPTTEAVVEWDSDDNRIAVGNGATTTVFYSGAHTTDTGPSPDCSGTTTYQDGEGNCDDIAATYADVGGDSYTGAHNFSNGSSFQLPYLTAPTTDSDGELMVDVDAWASTTDAIEFFDGTASTYLVGIQASDTCADNDIPKYDLASGTWSCEADGGGGSGALDDLSDVTITSVATGEFLAYAGSAWEEFGFVAGDGVSIASSGSAGSRSLTIASLTEECKTVMTLGAGDDDLPLDSPLNASDAVSAWCQCLGTCTTPATITFERNDGAAATIAGGDATCTARSGGVPTVVTFSGGELEFDAFDVLQMDVSNTPSANAGTNIICWTWSQD